MGKAKSPRKASSPQVRTFQEINQEYLNTAAQITDLEFRSERMREEVPALKAKLMDLWNEGKAAAEVEANRRTNEGQEKQNTPNSGMRN